MKKNKPLREVYLVLDNIRSAYNVGAIFRTCDATAVKKIYLCGITPHPPRDDIKKTALISYKSVSWEYNKDTALTIKNVIRNNISVIALDQTEISVDYRQFNYQNKIAIVVGNEVDGISKNVLDLCPNHIEIPMLGVSNSLNVATAVGVILYYLL